MAALLSAASPPRASAELAETGMDCTQDGMACRYWTPPALDAAKRYPLVLYLHGAGQSGNDNRSQVEDWGQMPRAFLDAGRRARFQHFFVAPQAPRPEGSDRWVDWDWSRGSYDLAQVPESASMKKALAILSTLKSRYRIDEDRVYVMGESMGGFGTWDAISRHPELFAAGVPADGGGPPKAASKLRAMAIFAAHFAVDGAVPASSDREMYRAVAAAGGRPIYLEVDASGHGVSGAFLGDEGFYEWLFAQRRGVAPTASFPLLDVSPAGGAFRNGPMVSIASGVKDAKVSLRYSLDGIPPVDQDAGLGYRMPFVIHKSAILHTVLFWENDDGNIILRRAAPFVVDEAALPGTAELPPDPSPKGQGGAGGTQGSKEDDGTGGGGSGAGGEARVASDEGETDEPPTSGERGCAFGGATRRSGLAMMSSALLALSWARRRTKKQGVASHRRTPVADACKKARFL